MRKALFWVHLVSGVVAGLVILMMSATGVVLTYETQMLEMAEGSYGIRARGAPLAPDHLLAVAEQWAAEEGVSEPAGALQVRSDPEAPVQVAFGREATAYLDPYTGAVVGTGFPRLAGFLSAVRGWHRWFDLSGDARGIGRAVTGASNLAFLVLLLTGAVLWIPRRRTWQHVKTVLFFRRTRSAKARDFNWHNVLGVWSLAPLTLVVVSGVYISYGWAKDLTVWAANVGVEAAVAAEARAAGRPEATPGPTPAARPEATTGATAARPDASLDVLLANAAEAVPGWRTLRVSLPADEDGTVTVRANGGFRGESRKAVTLTLAAAGGDVLEREGWEDLTRERRARSFLRFVHTGEFFGLLGQTLAGLVSLASVVLVWTGVSLALRRLARALRRRKEADAEPEGATSAEPRTPVGVGG